MNHAINDSSLPKRTALAEGIVVILLRNEIVELGLKNGSIGFVKDIVYKDNTGPRGPEKIKQHPAYGIFHFPDCKISEEDNIIPGWPRTYVLIVPYHGRCDHKCCAAIQVNFRLCKAITIHKSQGQSVVPNELWKQLVVEIVATLCRNKTPGLENVAFSRATALECPAVLDENDITYKMIMKIGKEKAYHKCCEYELQLRALASTTQAPIMEKVAAYDTATNKTFDDGYQALIHWYNQRNM
jgi:hypothetical protein